MPRLELFTQRSNTLAVHFGEHRFLESGGLVDDGAQMVEAAAAAGLENPQETVAERVIEGEKPLRFGARER